jgi:hypothetical protein
MTRMEELPELLLTMHYSDKTNSSFTLKDKNNGYGTQNAAIAAPIFVKLGLVSNDDPEH